MGNTFETELPSDSTLLSFLELLKSENYKNWDITKSTDRRLFLGNLINSVLEGDFFVDTQITIKSENSFRYFAWKDFSSELIDFLESKFGEHIGNLIGLESEFWITKTWLNNVLNYLVEFKKDLLADGLNRDNADLIDPFMFSCAFFYLPSRHSFNYFLKKFLDCEQISFHILEEKGMVLNRNFRVYFSIAVASHLERWGETMECTDNEKWLHQNEIENLKNQIDLFFESIQTFVSSERYLNLLKKFEQSLLYFIYNQGAYFFRDVSIQHPISLKSFFRSSCLDSVSGEIKSKDIWSQYMDNLFLDDPDSNLLYPLVEVGLHLRAEKDNLESFSTESLRAIYGV